MSARSFDAVVIGAGHNGLVAAATLAARGLSVCVLERAPEVGGMARNAMLDGVRVPEVAHLLYSLDPALERDLNLRSVDLPTVALNPAGPHLVVRGDQVRTADGATPDQAAAFAALSRRLVRFGGLLAQFSDHPPPTMGGGLTDPATLRLALRMGRFGLGLRRMGKAEMREFLRSLLSNAYDLILDELGADGPLAGLLAADAVRGAWAGPRSPGTVFSLMYRMAQGGGARLPLSGMGAVTEALARKARQNGADIRLSSGVAQVLIEDDRTTGVLLEDGSRIGARLVLSNAGALQTMHLAGVSHYDAEAVRRLRHLRSKGTAAKVNLVLSGAPEFTGLSAEQSAGRLVLAPSAVAVERAFNPVKYGEMSDHPIIEAVIPTLSDPGLAPDGRHVLSAVVTHVPTDGWDTATRDRLRANTIAALARFAPGLPGLVQAADVLAPPDIEARTGAPGGHWHHAEMGFDQLLTVRPVNGMSQYRFGPQGYYLCGAAAHPGGDVMGRAGRNAALQALRDREA